MTTPASSLSATLRREVLHEELVPVGRAVGDVVLDQAAVALQAFGTTRDRPAAVAADVEDVGAAAADDLEDHVLARAGDVEAVVALERVDDDLLDAVVRDEQAGAEDALVGDHEVVAELGADDGQRVEAVAALDRAPAS